MKLGKFIAILQNIMELEGDIDVENSIGQEVNVCMRYKAYEKYLLTGRCCYFDVHKVLEIE